jgi:hypothetical protein
MKNNFDSSGAILHRTESTRPGPFARWARALAAACLAMLGGSAAAAPFTPGNLAILRADSASANNTTVSVVELDTVTPLQTPTNIIPIDGTTLPNAIRVSGSATSTLYLSRSANGTLLSFTGHNSTTTSPANANTLNPRAVVTFNAAGTFALPTTYTGTSGSQTRSATSLNDTTWFIADQGGIYTNGGVAASPTGNVRSIRAFGNAVYTLQQSATPTVIVVSTVSAPSGGTITGLPGLTNSNTAQDFYMISSGDNGPAFDVLYITTNTSATVGAILKFSLVGGTWVANGSYATTFGGFAINAADSGSGAVLYVSSGSGATGGNSVIKLTDTAGYNAAINISTPSNVTLYTAPAATTIKGVVFAPVALPDLAVGVSAPATAPVSTNFDYTLTVSNAGGANAAGVAADFTIPAGLSFVSASGTNGFTGVNSSGTVNFTGGTINAGANATLTVTVSTAVGGTYTAPAGAAVADPLNTIIEANEGNNTSPAPAVTNVLVAPQITTQPNPSQTIASGATATLTVAANGHLPPTFQWYQGLSGDTSNPISGETATSFTTPALTVTTSYWVRATNASGTADSNTAVVNVSAANANLASLTLSAGTLAPPFASGTTSYTATVPNATTSLTVTPTAADSMATIKVNGSIVASGSPSDPINLNVGANVISVLVTAPDTVTTKTYTVTVTRLSNNADLSSLTLSAGLLAPPFAAATLSYTASVPNATTTVTVTPTVAHPAATVMVNGNPVTSGNPSAPIGLSVGPNIISVLVTAEDLSTKTYTVTVTRGASTNADLASLTMSTGAFSPAFASATTSYVKVVPNATTSVTVTPTVADVTATVTVNSLPVVSDSPSDAISLAEGFNTISTVVTAGDGTTTKTYTATVIRQSNAVLGPGSIAFTGYNADGDDNLAFVALVDIPVNTVIFFTDEEWNGTDWADFTEGLFAWTASSNIPAGTIVTIDAASNIYTTVNPATSNFGVVTGIPDATNNPGVSASDEAIFAFQGTGALNANGIEVPTAFLAVIANEDAAGALYSLDNTGLSEAAGTAIIFTEDDDGVRYKGPRNGQANFAGYLPFIADRATNWESVGGGDGTTYVPFNPAPFTAGPTVIVTINDVSVSEGNAGTTALNFTVTRANNTGEFTLQFATADGTGPEAATLADNDYQNGTGTVTFTAGGALTQPVTVLINGDTTVESNETLFVNLSGIVSTLGNAVISDAQGVGTILTDDPAPPSFTTQPASQTIPTGSAATLTVTTEGFPLPTFQWYEGLSGDTSHPIASATSATYVTPILLGPASYWVRASNSEGTADSNTANITVALKAPYDSGSINILTRNGATWNPTGVNVGGTQFINLGLQGVGRFPATSIDPATGESVGSMSDMQISGWHKNGDGSYSGTFNVLPDRGYNLTSPTTIFSNYAARINAYTFTFTPYTSAAPTIAQNQIAMTFAGSTRFTYDHDNNPLTPPVFTTGLLANGGTPLFGTMVPVGTGPSTQSDGTVTDRLTLDSEGLILDKRLGKDGSGWIGDEYGAYIYHFNSAKQIDGLLTLPEALIPHATTGGPVSFIDVPANVDGRRVNQGVEGIAQNPDGTRIFALMQSATMQDSGSGNQGRFNTRLLVYDISSSDTPTAPIAQYVIQLPRIDDTGLTTNGTAVNRTGAQSCIVALNDHQLLILARDGNGRGVPGSASPVFKSILLADLSAATDIDGAYDAAGAAVAPLGVLAPTVTPIAWTEALNMIGRLGSSIAEVEKFGLNLSGGNGDINTICEKWEALGLVSANDPANPNDYFLFIGNDNDFLTANGHYMDNNGVIQTYDAGLENDTLVLAYRVRFTAPELLVEETPGTEINTGSIVAYGSINPSPSVTKTFTVKNTGASTLDISSIGVTGGDAADFAVDLTGTSLSLAAGTQTTFQVTFAPLVTGPRTTTLQIVNNDFDEGTYAVALTGQLDQVSVFDGATVAAPRLSDGQPDAVDFGFAQVGSPVSRTFTIQNAGATPLTGVAVNVNGANFGDFVVAIPPPSTIPPAGSVTFRVDFMPSAAGTRDAAVHVLSSAPGTLGSFDFPVTGEGTTAVSVDDAVTGTVGATRVYPLANDLNLPAGAVITFASGTGVIISADGRSLLIPAGFSGPITYQTNAGTSATIDVSTAAPSIGTRFTGLLYDADGAIAGWSTATVSPKGYASVQVIVGTGKGKAKFSYKVTNITGSGTTALGNFTLTHNADGTYTASLAAPGGPFAGVLRPIPTLVTPRQYHVALASIDPSIPGGGYAVANVKKTGDVVITAMLPDGRPFTAGTTISDNGTIAFYGTSTKFVIPPAIVGGEFVSANLPKTDLTGEIAWLKPTQGQGAKGPHLGGVDTVLTANGCLYAGTIPLSGPGTLSLSGGNLLVDELSSVNVSGGIPTLTGSLKGWGGVKPTVGMFTAKVKVPGIIKPVAGAGVYLPKSNSAWGYFPGTTLGGRIQLTVP